jgi:hypothetical protein
MQRRPLNPSEPLGQRLLKEALSLRAQAALLPPGPLRDETIRKAQQAETGSQMSEWLGSRGPRPPR